MPNRSDPLNAPPWPDTADSLVLFDLLSSGTPASLVVQKLITAYEILLCLTSSYCPPCDIM